MAQLHTPFDDLAEIQHKIDTVDFQAVALANRINRLKRELSKLVVERRVLTEARIRVMNANQKAS